MSLIQYVLRYFARSPTRAVLTISGVSVAISAIVFAYGLAGWVETYSARSLSQVTGNAKIWIVPRGGVVLHPNTGLIIPVGTISEETIGLLEESGINLRQVVAGPVNLMNQQVILYGDERVETSGLLVSSELWVMLNHHSITANVNGENVLVVGELSTLPQHCVVTSLKTARQLLKVQRGASWLLSNDPTATSWARTTGPLHDLKVSSDPISSSEETPAIIYLLEGTTDRFDPFSFRTKFSALTLNSALTTMFGLTSRFVFLLGVILAVSSNLLSLRERRDEVALFAVAGLESSVSLLFLMEACFTQLLCLIVGSAIGLGLLRFTLGSALTSDLMTQAIAFGVVYLPILIVLNTIIPSQIVAKRRPIELLRGTI